MGNVQLVVDILGGEKSLGAKITSFSDFDPLVRRGFSWTSVAHAKAVLSISDKNLAEFFEVSSKTISRQKKERRRLGAIHSDRLLRIAKVVSLATEVFESRENALSWLNRPQTGLGERIPMEMLMTEAGTRDVEDLLIRIEHSVIA